MEMIARKKNKAIVRDFYQRILQRLPEPAGALYYEEVINRLGIVRAIPEMLSAFLSSEEFERIQAARGKQVASTLAAYGDLLIDGQPVSHVVSLGTHCLGSTILKNGGLKKYSAPFDWIFSTPQMVLDCLADDFAVFLDRRHYKSSTDSRGRVSADHERYLEQYGEWVFAHRDPTQDDDYQYLVRSVERFRRLLASADAKLFVMISRPNHDLAGAFPSLIDALDGRTERFSLLCIQLTTNTGLPGVSSVTSVARQGQHSLYQFAPSSNESHMADFPDKLDEWTILRLVHSYRINLKDSPVSRQNDRLKHHKPG